jgi:hypothetical protein
MIWVKYTLEHAAYTNQQRKMDVEGNTLQYGKTGNGGRHREREDDLVRGYSAA